jgi:hypothetical protein
MALSAKETCTLELRFTVWQFVRLMVHLEDSAHLAPPQADLLKVWGDIWQPLDGELAQLSEQDMDAYSDMMMDQDVVIEDATPAQAQAAHKSIIEIMTIMDKAIEAGGEPDHIQDLKFERRELRQLSRQLAYMD